MQTGFVSSWKRALAAPSPYSSFVGGAPRPLPGAPPRPSCARCGAPLALVLQLYAPTDEAERQLLVFGCNAATCAGAAAGGAHGGGAWVALRTTRPARAPSAEEAAAAAAAAEAAAADDAPPPPSDDWGVAAEWGDAVGGVEWAPAAPPAVTAPPAVAAAGGDAAPTDGSGASAAAGGGDDRAADGAYGEGPRFGCFAVETAFGAAADESESESDSDSERAAGAGGGGARGGGGSAQWSATEWDRVQAMLADYNAREAAEAAGTADPFLAASDAAAGEDDDDDDEAGSGGGGGGGDSGGSRGAAGGAAATAAAARSEGGGAGGGGERYEKTPARLRYLLRFQRRLARTPTQVMRYLWDSPRDALWPVPPAARPAGAPPCACGAARRLEVQLLPTVLYGLRVDDAPGGGMDFLSVFVFACEADCAASTEEFVWVCVESEGGK